LRKTAHKNRERTTNDTSFLETPGAGQPLEANVRALMEPRFAHDFAKVRIHADGEADTLARSQQAHAFAFGNDLYFRDGAYDPSSKKGMYTLAHELTHVVQQSGAVNGSNHAPSQPNDRSELEAATAARDVMMGGSVNVQAGSVGQAQVSRMDEDEEKRIEYVAAMASLPPTMDPPPASIDPLLEPINANPLNPSIPKPPGVPTGGMGTRVGPGYDPFLEQVELETELANAEARVAQEAIKVGTADTIPAAAAEEAAALGTAETIPAAAAGAETTAVAAGAESTALGTLGAGIGAIAAPLLAGLGTLLWSNKTAPRWMDEMNPLNGKPYTSEQEFQDVQREMKRRAAEQ
jgi:Domain of unknown function (DUF4157)